MNMIMRFFSTGTEPSELSLESGWPIPLVYTDGKGEFHMDESGMKMLQSLKEPVAIVSVCGRVHQGKSFLLNQLLGRNSGFQVASEDAICTHGLWLWSVPLRRTASDGTIYHVLFMDTEAIDAYHLLGTRSMKMVSLAVLLSSTLIYNQMGGIDDVALHLISLVMEMTKKIQLQASLRSNAATELSSPNLLFLLRDFYLGMRDKPKAYLERTLSKVDRGGSNVAAFRNKMRESIRASFPDLGCCTLMHPVIEENGLQQLDKKMSDRLRPEFRDGLATLKTLVSESTKPKQASGGVMTGPVFVGVTELLLDVLNSGALPSSWQDGEGECLYRYTSCERMFMRKFNSRLRDEVSKEVLEKELLITASGLDDFEPQYQPLPEIYRTCLITKLEKKIVERCHAAERHAQFQAEERAKILSAGLQARQKKLEDCSQESANNRTCEDDITNGGDQRSKPKIL